MFNHEQCHESKVKHRIQDELIICAKATWERVIKQIKINNFFVVAMLQGFDQTWGARNVLCRRHNLLGIGSDNVDKSLNSLMGNFGGLGVVLGKWGGSCFWLGGSGGSSLPSMWAQFLGS